MDKLPMLHTTNCNILPTGKLTTESTPYTLLVCTPVITMGPMTMPYMVKTDYNGKFRMACGIEYVVWSYL